MEGIALLGLLGVGYLFVDDKDLKIRKMYIREHQKISK